MKAILLSSLFPPEPVVGAQTSFSVAKGLSDAGHQVIVVTAFPSRPAGKIYPEYKNKFFSKEKSEHNFEIMRCFSLASPKSTFLSRFLENISFGLSAFAFILFAPRPDVIFSDTWPIFATGLMSIVARLRRIPYVVKVVDLYPESIVSQKRVKADHWLIKVMRKIDQWIAKGAEHLIVITSYFEQIYREDRKISTEKISFINDWVVGDLDCVAEDEAKAVRRKFGISDEDFVVAYGGNIGVAAGVQTLVEASALIDDIWVIIAGDGSELMRCQQLAGEIAPSRVAFFSPWPKDQTMPLYQAADVLVLPTHGEQSFASIPSKLIRYMLSGRPVIAMGLPGTELTNTVRESQCGLVIPPDDPQALAQAINEARSAGPSMRSWRGRAGREYAMKNMAESVNLPKVVDIIEKVSIVKQPQPSYRTTNP